MCVCMCFVQAERQSQQQWERELQERERRLKQQEEAFGSLAGLEEMVRTGMLAVEEVGDTNTQSHSTQGVLYIFSPHLDSYSFHLTICNSVVLNDKLPNYTPNHTVF